MKVLWLQAAAAAAARSRCSAPSRARVLAQLPTPASSSFSTPALSEASGDEALAMLQAAANGTALRHPLRRRRAAARPERQRLLSDALR
jgi:hypothetical protein